MSIQANKEFIHRYLEDVCSHPKTEALLRKYITDETLIEHILASEAAFPMYKIELEEMIAEGDLVSLHGTLYGTHQGLFMNLPGTGKTFSLPLFVTYRVVGGMIVDHWMILDSADLMRQLGNPQSQDIGVSG
jgi:predicted ester cyclase